MAKKFNQTVLTFACVAALAAAQIAPVAVPVFGAAIVKAEEESNSLMITHVTDMGTNEEKELSYIYLLEPEDSVKIEPISLEGYSYIGIVNTGKPNDLGDAARDGLITYSEIADEWGKVTLEYAKNTESPEEAPTPDQGGGQQDGSNNGDTDTSIEPPSSEETPGLTLDTTTPPSNNDGGGNQEGDIPAPNPDKQTTPPKEDAAPSKPGEPAPEAPKDTRSPIDVIKDNLPPRTTPDTPQKTPEMPQGQGDSSTPSPQKDGGKKDTAANSNPDVTPTAVEPAKKVEEAPKDAPTVQLSAAAAPQEAPKKTLPNTGDSSLVGAALSGLGSLLSVIGLFSLRKKD